MSKKIIPQKYSPLVKIAAIAIGTALLFTPFLTQTITEYQSQSQPTPQPVVSEQEISQEITVSKKQVAEKLNLERKVIATQNTNQVAQLVEDQGGQVLETGDGTLVAHIPQESQDSFNQTLSEADPNAQQEVDYPVFLTADSPDWGVVRVQAPDVWETTTASRSAVAVIDTGVDYAHPELTGRFVSGIDLYNQDDDPMDDHGHGTHVAGIIAASLNDNGIAGVGPGAGIVAIKALGADGTGYLSDILDALDWASENQVPVINLSLGTTYDSSLLEEKVNQVTQNGSLIVASAGNTSGGSLLYPAAYDSVIAVGATAQDDTLASFSSLGAEVVAPGVSITSTVPGGGYATWSGTSMAAPHVAATLALMLDNQQDNVRQRLRDTAYDLGSPGVDGYFGYGLINAKPAALGDDTLAPVVTFIEPEDGASVAGVMNIELTVQDENTIENASLFLNDTQLASWDESPYTYEWDTTNVEEGEHQLIATATDTFDNLGQALVNLTVDQSATSAATPSPAPTATVSATPESGRQFGQSLRETQGNNTKKPTKDTNPKDRQTDSNASSHPPVTPTPTKSIPTTSNHDQRQPQKELDTSNKPSSPPGKSGNKPTVKGISIKRYSLATLITQWFSQIMP